MASPVNLITVLQKTVSTENAELVAAQNFLEEAVKADLPGLLRQLSDILANSQCEPVVRMQAGLQLKNAIYSKDPALRVAYQQRWLEFPPECTNYIKQKCLDALGTETTAHSSAAQCVAYIACAETPSGRWPTLIENVRLAATNALLNSLEFTKHNFDVEVERNYIIYMEPYMGQALFADESSDDDEWNPSKAAGVCIMLLAQCCEDAIVELVIPFVRQHIENPDWKYRDAAVMSFGSILEGPNPTALKPLVESAMPVIINLLRDQSSAVRDTTAWTIGRVCEILPEVALTDGYLVPLLQGLLDGLSSEPRVAANVCWAFSSLAESAGEVALEHELDTQGPATYALSKYFNVITERILATSSRPDGAQHNLRNAAYSALMALMRSAAKDCYDEVRRVTVIVLDRLKSVLDLESQVISSQDRAQFNDLQSLLCATLQSVLRKINKEDAPALSDQIMLALMSMFNSTLKPNASTGAGDQASSTEASKGSDSPTGVQEDALLAVSALLEVLGEGFLKYLDAFMPALLVCLSNCSETQVCLNAIGLMGDLCRVLSRHIAPHTDALVSILMQILQNVEADKTIRPAIISAFGDLSLALGPGFTKYLTVVMETLKQATQAEVDLNDLDMVDYLNSLWSSCLEAYTGIVQGLKGDDNQPSPQLQFVATHVPFILSFVQHAGSDPICTEEIISSSCGLIGDLVSAFGAEILPIVDVEPIQNILTQGRRAKSGRTRNVAIWATKEIKKMQNAAKADQLGAHRCNEFVISRATLLTMCL
ncbi:Importin subunit beta-1 [Sparganum proliferum]